MPALATRSGYRATRDADGTLVVHGVPIFVECEKVVGAGEKTRTHQFDAEWIEAAVLSARAAELEGYFPPLHIRHHEDGAEVRPAGFFRVIGTTRITFKGEPRIAVLADLHVTDPDAQREILQKRLPYRSVEILKVSKPAIDSLALLDHEVPFLQLPMLTVTDVGVSPETLDRNVGSTVAIFKRGESAALLFQMGDQDQSQQDDDQKDAGPKDAKVVAVIAAIESGEISVADMQALVAAIRACGAGASQDDQKPNEPDPKKPAKAPAPGVAMRNQPDETTTMTEKKEVTPQATNDEGAKLRAAESEAVKLKAQLDEANAKLAARETEFAKQAGRLDGLEAKLAAREASDTRREAVAVAMKQLEGRPMGADLEKRLTTFHEKHGDAAFKAYVDEMTKTLGALPPAPHGARMTALPGGKLPAVAMKYQDKGADAVEQAAKFCAEWSELKKHNGTRLSEARYVELRMSEPVAITG